jgi:hypothetical protein
MAKTGQKVLIGCGIGCGVIVAATLIVGGGAGLLLKNFASSFKQAERAEQVLSERYGAVDDYEPPPFGVVTAARMDAFLAVREATQEARTGIAAALTRLDDADEDNQGVRAVVAKVKAGIGVGTDIGRLLETRNQSLLEVGMGLGEYTYLYSLAYYALLGHPPTDGPEGSENVHIGHSGGGIHISNDSDDVRRSGYGPVRRDLRRILRRQMHAIGDDAAAAELAWRARIEAEIERMRTDDAYPPWRDDMPEPMASAIRPYTDRLEETYAPLVNPFELIPAED